MVAGAYSKSDYSRNKPVVLKYAPSHAERPQGRGTREKGRGWQRSKSSSNDYGSDFYFSEETTTHRQRAQSSLSGRRTDRNSNSSEIVCPAKQQRRRRASIEAIVESSKPESATAQAPVPIGPPIQKRLLTVKETVERDTLSPNRAIVGHTDTLKIKSFHKPPIFNREGPKARPYSPKPVTGAKADFFPLEDPTHEKTSYDPKYRLMDTLVYTDAFKERSEDIQSVDNQFATSDIQPWEIHSSYPIDPDDKFLREMRIELDTGKVPDDGIVRGRVFFDLKKPLTINSLEVNSTNVLTMSTPEGITFENKSTDKNQPFDFKWTKTFSRRVNLPEGANEFPFELSAPTTLYPSYTYVSKEGKMVINSYVCEAMARIGQVAKSTGAVAIEVPALLEKNRGSVGPDTSKYCFMVFNENFTDKEGFDFSVFYEKKNKPKKVNASVIREIKCPRIGVDEKTEFELGEVLKEKGTTNEVLRKFKENSKTQGLVPETEWKGSRYRLDNRINSSIPSIPKGDFTCQYTLMIDVDGEQYSLPVYKVDGYLEN